jgi:hypothetical protein
MNILIIILLSNHHLSNSFMAYAALPRDCVLVSPIEPWSRSRVGHNLQYLHAANIKPTGYTHTMYSPFPIPQRVLSYQTGMRNSATSMISRSYVHYLT